MNEWCDDGPVRYRILGHDIQAVEFLIIPGDKVVFQPNTFVCGAGGFKGLHLSWGTGMMDPLKRKWAGEMSVLQQIMCDDKAPARVVIGGAQFGKVVSMRVRPGRGIICQRGVFLAATGSIDIGVAFTRRLRAGWFGHQGLTFQRLTGDGEVFLHASGAVVDWTILNDTVVPVSTKNILAFEDTVGYDVQLSGGLMTMMFGGQGVFLSQLQGPGRILIQSMDIDSLYRTNTASAGLFHEAKNSIGER